MKVIHASEAPQAIGPYSQATMKNGILFISGQLGVNPSTGEVADSFEKQTELIFSHLSHILSAADMSFADAVKVTIYLKNMNNFAKMNEIYSRYFSEPYPAREAVEVARLPKNVSIEISLIAMR